MPSPNDPRDLRSVRRDLSSRWHVIAVGVLSILLGLLYLVAKKLIFG